VLSWIAFGDPALICRFEGRYNLYSYRFHKHPRSGNPKRPMLVSKPDRTLLDALQDGVLTAIRNGAEIPSSHWFGKHTSHLSDDLRFRRAEVIRCWRAEGEEAAITMAAARRVRSKPRDDKPVRRPPSREKKFWQAAREAAVEWLIENGCPAPNDGHQAELERHVTEWLEGHGYEAGESSVRRHAASWIKEYREKLKT
jgi:hypothetical protein